MPIVFILELLSMSEDDQNFTKLDNNLVQMHTAVCLKE